MDNKVDAGIGQRMSQLRNDLGLNQDKLAELVGVDRTYISNLERGKSSNPTIEIVFALAAALKTSPQYLLGLDEFAGVIVDGMEDLSEPLREVVAIASRLSAGRQNELRYVARALAAAEDAEMMQLQADLSAQKELLRALYATGGEKLLRQFFVLVGVPEILVQDMDSMRIRIGF